MFILTPYIIFLSIIFYVLPLLIIDTGSGMFILVLVIPVLIFVCSVIYGIKHGFSPLFTLITAILFAPSILIFYNSTAWIYIVVYSIISFVGNIIAIIPHKKA